ncbi:MAG: aldo/keto reductase [Bacteroidetes bacterium]|nr:aldo/keto reductase [Bacteroidota bacterium]
MTHKNPFSKIIAGTMTWGVWGKNLNTAEMSSLMHVCLDAGISTFDHADIYGGYTTEAAFGKAFKDSGVSRTEIQLISKCGIQYTAEIRNNRIKHYDYSEDYIIWSVEQSLQNLQTDYLDLLLLHRPSPLMRAEEIASAVEKLISSGKIKDFGVSNFTTMQTDLIQKTTPVHYNQIQFSATNLEAMLNGSLDYMQLNSIIPMAWSPLGTAFKSEDEKSLRVKKIAEQLAEQHNTTSDVILLAWILKHPAGILPVCGTTDAQRIKNLPRAIEINLDIQDWFAIWVESAGNKVP